MWASPFSCYSDSKEVHDSRFNIHEHISACVFVLCSSELNVNHTYTIAFEQE